MYKDAKTGLMLINVADFDLLNDQALTPQLLRASKPMYALAATMPPSDLHHWWSDCHRKARRHSSLADVFAWKSHDAFHARGNWIMDEYPDTYGHLCRYINERHCGRTRDFSLGDREDRQMLVRFLRRRFPKEVHQTSTILIDCRAFRDPANSTLRNHWEVHSTTLSKIYLNHHKFPRLLLELVE